MSADDLHERIQATLRPYAYSLLVLGCVVEARATSAALLLDEQDVSALESLSIIDRAALEEARALYANEVVRSARYWFDPTAGYDILDPEKYPLIVEYESTVVGGAV